MREKILEIIKIRGPVIPRDIAKALNIDNLYASAHLAELSDNGLLKITSVKYGGTPFYYMPEQKEKLLSLAKHLNEKDRETLKLLQEKKILYDHDKDLLTRVSLRNIGDYAIQIKFGEELYWRFYLVPEEEAMEIIRKMERQKLEDQRLMQKQEITKETQQEIPLQTTELAQKTEIRQEQIKQVTETKFPGHLENRRFSDCQKHEVFPSISESPILREIDKPKSEVQSKITEKIQTKPKAAKQKQPRQTQDNFLNSITNYLNKLSANIRETKIIKKNKELDLVIEMSSSLGKTPYFCKAYNKKAINEADISMAFMQGEIKKFPVLILTNGKLTKRAQELIDNNTLNITIKNIE